MAVKSISAAQLADKIKALVDDAQRISVELEHDTPEAQSVRRAATLLGDAHAELSRN